MNPKCIKKFLLLILITAFFSYSLTKLKIGNHSEYNFSVYSIQFDYYGIDPIKLEKLITIPLEEKISELDSIYEIKSTIEYNKTITTVWFYKTSKILSLYQNLTQIADDVYNSLPPNVQKPQILGTDMEQKSTICISFDADETFIERNIKPLFESLDGVTQILITGGSKSDINILYSPEKLSSYMLTPFDISEAIENENSRDIFINHKTDNFITNIFFNNKLNSLSSLEKNLFLSKNISAIKIEENTKDQLVLLNDKPTLFLNIKTNPDANLISISNNIQKLLRTEPCNTLNPIIIYDQGSIQKKELTKTGLTLFLTILISEILIFIIYHNYYIQILTFIEIILTLIWTISTFPIYNQFIIPILQLIKPNHHFELIILNQNSLSGLSLSIGLITDVLLVLYELYLNSKTSKNFIKNYQKFSLSALTSTVTTIIAVIPLFFTNSIISGISSSAFTIILMLIYSTIISLLFIPTFLIFSNTNIHNKSKIIQFKLITKLIYALNQKHRLMQIIFLLFLILSSLCFVLTQKNIESTDPNGIIYTQINFNPEKSKESIQQTIFAFIKSLQSIPEITFIKSECSRGHADLEIIYTKLSEYEITHKIKSRKMEIPEAYIYISETSKSKKEKPVTLQFAIIGDNELTCRKLAKQTAALFSEQDFVLQTVLNFTDEETMYSFTPNQFKLAKLGFTVSNFAELFRINIFSPVISKYFLDGIETDIKLKNINKISPDNLYQQKIFNSIPLESLGKTQKTIIPSKLYRHNCQPCAYFSIEINKNNLMSSIKKIKSIIKSIKMENNYLIVFPKAFNESQSSYRKLTFSIIICLICIYIFLTSFNEKPMISFYILLTIPVSLFIPLFIRIITNTALNFGDFTGIILLSGTVINNSIYISESPQTSLIKKALSCQESIFITSMTTIFSSVPILIFSHSPYTKSLSFFMLYGTLGSLLTSLFLFPSFLKSNLK